MTPPTNIAATTAVPPTSAPPLATPAEVATAEIEATLTALNAEIYDCFEAPEACDVDAILDKYFVSKEDYVRRIFKDVWEQRIQKQQIKISDGLMERKIAWITADEAGTAGTSFLCEVDGSFNIPKDTPAGASTTVPPDLTRDYIRFYYEWERQLDNSWKITRSEFSAGYSRGAKDVGELPTLTESEIAQCD